jgi:PKD repeat protein
VDGGTSRFDRFGIVYHAVCAGCAAFNNTGGPTSDFPTTPNAKSRTNKSKNCNNAAFKFDLASLRARFQTNTVNFDTPNFNNVCFPDSIAFQNKSTGGEIFIWTLGDGTVITKDNSDTTSVIHQFPAEGSYTVKLKVIDYNTCKATDSTTSVIEYFKDEIAVMDDADICEGDELKLHASGGNTYQWSTKDNSFQSGISNPDVNPQESTSYYVYITDADGCSKLDTVVVNVVPGMDLKWDLEYRTDCISQPSIHVRNTSEQESDVKYWFDFGDGQTSEEQEVTHTFSIDSTYTIRLLGQREFCVFEVSNAFPFYTLFVPNVITPNESAGLNDTLVIGFGTDHTPADVDIPVALTIVDRWGKKIYQTDNYLNDWKASDVEGGVYYVTVTLGDLATCKNWVHVVK